MNPGTILLVEDNRDEIDLLKEALVLAGILNPIETVSDGRTALDYLERKQGEVDRKAYALPVLILLDLKLPRLSGLEVLEWIKARPEFRETPVVMLTSSHEQGDMDRAYEAGANSYLVKPTQFTEFVEMLKVTATYWIKYNKSQLSR